MSDLRSTLSYMRTIESKVLETIRSTLYVLHPSSPWRRHLKLGRCRLFVADVSCVVPAGEFDVSQGGVRYRCRRDGRLSRTVARSRVQPLRNVDHFRERFYYPVRILSIERESRTNDQVVA